MSLTPTEKRLLAATAAGEPLKLTDEENIDPTSFSSWGDNRRIRGHVIASLYDGVQQVHRNGVSITGALITGVIDLAYVEVKFPTALTSCTLVDAPLIASQAHLRNLTLAGCVLLTSDLEPDWNRPKEPRLDLTGATVDGDVKLLNVVVASGALAMDRCVISGDLVLSDVDVGAARWGPVVPRPHVRRSIVFEGDADLTRVHSELADVKNQEEVARYRAAVARAHPLIQLANNGFIGLSNAQVISQLVFRSVTVRGEVNLQRASAGTLVLEPDFGKGALLDGFTYGTILPGPPPPVTLRPADRGIPVADRLRLLEPESFNVRAFTPSAYDALAAAYTRGGYEEAARDVLLAKQRNRRRTLRVYHRVLDWLWDITIRYGFATWRALLALVAVVGIGALVFSDAYPANMIATVPAERQPTFQPLLYSADVVVPIINMRHAQLWLPGQGFAASWYWISIVAGWLLTTTIGVGLSGVLARRG